MGLSFDPLRYAAGARAAAAALSGRAYTGPDLPLPRGAQVGGGLSPAAPVRRGAKTPTPVQSPQGRPPVDRLFAPLTEEDINRIASQRAGDILQAQADPIQRAKENAARRALGEQQAKIGFTGAAQKALPGVGLALNSAYSGAETPLGAPGMSPEAGGFVAADKAAIGGTGQAAQSWADELGSIQGNLGQQELASLIASGEGEQRDFDQQLIDLEKQRPGIMSQVYDQLYQREFDKLNARLAQARDEREVEAVERDYKLKLLQLQSDEKTNALKAKLDERELALRERAQTSYEKAAGLNTSKEAFDQWLDVQKLKLADKKQSDSVQAAIDKGNNPSASLSKAYGYIVDSNGDPILDANGKQIPVVATTKKSTKATPYQSAVKEARQIRGGPVLYTGEKKVPIPLNRIDASSGVFDYTIKGKYIAAPWAKGVFSVPDGKGGYIRTTNNPNKAQRQSQFGSFAEAQAYIVQHWGVTPAQARKALISGGWRPDGKRPASKQKTVPVPDITPWS